MAIGLPYFKFMPQEWINDDISFLSYEAKGLFIDICSFYWVRDCSITIALLKQKFSSSTNEIKILLDNGIIKTKKDSDFIEIKFLDKQFDELSDGRKKRQIAGSKGGKKKATNAKAKLQQFNSNALGKRKEEEEEKINTPKPQKSQKMTISQFEQFWLAYPKKAGKANAEKGFLKLPSELFDVIMDSIKEHKKSEQWIKDGGQFIPMASTFVNQKRWEDTIEIEVEKPGLMETIKW